MKVSREFLNNISVARWVIDNVGAENVEYDFKTETFEFLRDEDAVAFKLRFGYECNIP
jgi:hypothetical protein